MSARTVIGVIISTIGLLLLLFAGLDFHNLFFVQKMFAKSDIPTYNQAVVLPALLGFLILLDGSLFLTLKRVFSLGLHLLANFVWLYWLYRLYLNLAVPVTDVSAYQQIFYLAFLGIIIFVLGVIVNDIPRQKQ